MRLMEPVDYKFDITRRTTRGVLSMVHLCDLHFGAIDPKTEFDILEEQILRPIEKLPILDIISINGDLFHRKYMSNTDPILYASLFMSRIRSIAIKKNATVILIAGTREHDAGQLQLFYHYLDDPEFDIRIVETIQFEYVKGSKILCIPELYGVEENIYKKFLWDSGEYDMCFMHGTIKGAIYGDNAGQSRLFSIEDFGNCLGPIISGHVHVAGCFNNYFYYGGSPIRWKFGEEQEKGFLIVLYDLDKRYHYTHLVPVYSFRYDTINIDDIMTNDPKDVIQYINDLQEKDNIDYIRITLSEEFPSDNIELLKSYYQNNGKIKLKLTKSKQQIAKESMDNKLYEEYSYIFDKNLSPYEILAKYINDQENSVLVSADVIKDLVEGKM